jgi:hypothetical protein
MTERRRVRRLGFECKRRGRARTKFRRVLSSGEPKQARCQPSRGTIVQPTSLRTKQTVRSGVPACRGYGRTDRETQKIVVSYSLDQKFCRRRRSGQLPILAAHPNHGIVQKGGALSNILPQIARRPTALPFQKMPIVTTQFNNIRATGQQISVWLLFRLERTGILKDKFAQSQRHHIHPRRSRRRDLYGRRAPAAHTCYKRASLRLHCERSQ